MSGSDGETPGGDGPESETGRLEAFSDGVLAVIITIMALELKAPVEGTFGSLKDRLPALLVYILSFTFIGIYWNNHHHLLRAARRVTPAVMWSNLHLLFWLSLIPVLTEWIGDEHWDKTAPAATYGVVCLASAVAFTILATVIIRADGKDSPVAAVGGQSIKAQASLVLYAGGTVVAFFVPWIAYILYAVVSVIWFIPDRTLGRMRVLLHTIKESEIVNARFLGQLVYNTG
jgi:TMEM175 potassium channel family protein